MDFLSPVISIWMALAIATFVVLLFRTAPYGRHADQVRLPTLPHRVGWIIMETVSPLALCAGLILTGNSARWPMLLVVLWVGHYVYRAWIYPFRARWANKRMPIVIMLSAIGFNVVNGGLNGMALADESYSFIWNRPTVWVGAALFAAGLLVNLQSDRILMSLRAPGETDYRIPRGGFFRWVSCPNYLGELVEWIGFALMAATPAAWAFALWTAANLIPRALSHHRWYQSHFAEYPRQRQAVIPFVL